jgi:hypothetical protein
VPLTPPATQVPSSSQASNKPHQSKGIITPICTSGNKELSDKENNENPLVSKVVGTLILNLQYIFMTQQKNITKITMKKHASEESKKPHECLKHANL